MKDQAPFSFMRELNSSASSEYDWYVEGSSSVGPQVRIIGLRPAPSSILNVTKIESHAITLLSVENEMNWEIACPSRDLIYLLRCSRAILSGSVCGFASRSLIIFLGLASFQDTFLASLVGFERQGMLSTLKVLVQNSQ